MIMTTPRSFSGAALKRVRREPLSEAINRAAVAIVKALSTDSKDKKEKASEGPQPSCSPGSGVSPG